MKDWFTLNEAADFSGLGNTTIRSKIKSGDLKAVKRPSKYGPRWEIHREALLGFVEEQPFIDGEDLGGLRGVTIRVEDEPAESTSKEPCLAKARACVEAEHPFQPDGSLGAGLAMACSWPRA